MQPALQSLPERPRQRSPPPRGKARALPRGQDARQPLGPPGNRLLRDLECLEDSMLLINTAGALLALRGPVPAPRSRL
jgi:hypothetical protein